MDNQNNQKKKNENNFKKKTTTKKNEVKFKNFEDNDKPNLKKKTNVINGHNKSLKNMLKDKEKANENNISNNINNKNKSKIDFNNNNNKNKSINININSKKDNRINIKNEMNGKTRQTLQNNFILSQNPNNNNKNPSLMILKNIGNTTYINSVIRIISNIKEISNFYLNKFGEY
jgi:DNA excision repair protein ERCC-3